MQRTYFLSPKAQAIVYIYMKALNINELSLLKKLYEIYIIS